MYTKQSLDSSAQFNVQRYFWLFIIIHVLAWTVGPTLVRGSVPHDTLEGIAWGLQWQLGYNKHPFLTAWACAFVTQLFGTVGWPVYLLAQLAVATTFFAVWRLANKILPSIQALLATLILEGVLFYNLNSFNLTPDSMQSPIWALLALFFYQALTTQAIRYWLLTGLMAALAMVTKYQVALLFLPMLLFCLINPQARQSFKKPGLYCAIVLTVILLIPHLIWLYHNDFITLTYAVATPTEYTHQYYAWPHLVYPVRYLANNLGNVLGLFILLWPFYTQPKARFKIGAFNWQFLLGLGFGPLVLSLTLCVITGSHFPPRWSTPYFFLLGIIAVAGLKPQITRKRLLQFILTLILVGGLIWAGRMASIALGPKFDKALRSDTYLPNQEMALTLTALWHQQYHQPLRYIAGSRYLVAALVTYSPDHPIPYFDWNLQESPWVNETVLRKKGALFVWDVGANYTWDAKSAANTQLPSSVIQKFPALKQLGNYDFNRLTTLNSVVTIGVGLLPPSQITN